MKRPRPDADSDKKPFHEDTFYFPSRNLLYGLSREFLDITPERLHHPQSKYLLRQRRSTSLAEGTLKKIIKKEYNCVGGICTCVLPETDALIEEDEDRASVSYAFPGCNRCGAPGSSEEFGQVVKTLRDLKFRTDEYSREVTELDTLSKFIKLLQKSKKECAVKLKEEKYNLRKCSSELNEKVNKLWKSSA